jgi:biopolymer transport protein ExbD
MKTRNARREPAPDEIVDINTTPLIDVMLVLLIMLIITIPAQLHNVKLDLTVKADAPKVSEVIRLDIDPGDQIFWNGQAVSPQELAQRLSVAAQQATSPELHIRPQTGSHYATLAKVMATAQQQGLKKLGILGTEQWVK